MKEPFDEFADQFTIVGGPYGVALSFRRSAGQPPALGTVVPSLDVGTVRLSRELAKRIAQVMTQWVEMVEHQGGVIKLPEKSNDPSTLDDLWGKQTQ